MAIEAHREEVLRAFYRVRQALGWLGLAFPLALVAGGLMSLGGVEPSISDYYHTVLRDLYVGVLCAIGIFLISYTGYRPQPGEWLSDDAGTTLAGIAAFGVAFLPNGTGPDGTTETVSQMMLGPAGAAIGHYVSAVVFLSCLGWICLSRFARTARPGRRRLYRACGWTVLAMTVGVAATSLVKIGGPPGPRGWVVETQAILWLEAVAIWAFSLAWLAKGRADMSLARLVRRRRDAPGAERTAPGE